MEKQKLSGSLRRLLDLRGADTGSWLIAELNAALEKPEVGDRPAGWMHASLLDHPCDRYVGYFYAGVRWKGITPAQTAKRFRTGEQIELRILQDLDRAGLLEKEYMESKKDPWSDKRLWRGKPQAIEEERIKFTPDAVIHHPEHGYKIVLECKTANTWGFNKKKETPDPGHVSRTNFYMGALDIPRGIILLEHKDSHEQAVHYLELDREAYATRIHRARKVRKTVDAGDLPDKTEWPKGGCLKCPYFNICNDETLPHEAPKMLPGIIRVD